MLPLQNHLFAACSRLAPVISHFLTRSGEESLSVFIAESTMQNRKGEWIRKNVLPTQVTQAHEALSSLWLFAREYIRGHTHLRKTDAHKAYIAYAEQQVAAFNERTRRILRDIDGEQPVVPGRLFSEKYAMLPGDDVWAAADAVLLLAYDHAYRNTADQHQRKLFKSVLAGFAGNLLTYRWVSATEELNHFRFELCYLDGRAVHPTASALQWPVAQSQSVFGTIAHPELTELNCLVLKDMAVPLPWRGLGFGRVLRDIEQAIALQSTRVHYLFLDHVHRDMLVLTMDRRAHGYRHWAPVDDADKMRALAPEFYAALEDIAARDNAPADSVWRYAYTKKYGQDPTLNEPFHLYWLSPLGTRLADMSTALTARAAREPLLEFAQHWRKSVQEAAPCTTLAALQFKSSWAKLVVLPCAGCSSLSVRLASHVTKEQDAWALSLVIVPAYSSNQTSYARDARVRPVQAELIAQMVRLARDFVPYLPTDRFPVPPVMIKLFVRFSVFHRSEDSSELYADLLAHFPGDVVDAHITRDHHDAVYPIINIPARVATDPPAPGSLLASSGTLVTPLR